MANRLRLLAFFSIVTMLYAQSNAGSITGRLTDATGAILANASVVITNSQTGVHQRTVSNDSGYYVTPLLGVGTYESR